MHSPSIFFQLSTAIHWGFYTVDGQTDSLQEHRFVSIWRRQAFVLPFRFDDRHIILEGIDIARHASVGIFYRSLLPLLLILQPPLETRFVGCRPPGSQ